MPKRPAKAQTYIGARPPAHLPLICLTEQGEPVRVETAVFGLAGRDRSWQPYADGFVRANTPQFSALEIETALSHAPGAIDISLRGGGAIGAVPMRAPDTQRIHGGVVVRPRYGWNEVGALLSAIGWSAAPDLLPFPLVPGSAREVPPWVLAGPVLHRFQRLLQEISRGFQVVETVRNTPRGQILWSRYAQEQVVHGRPHAFPCRFPELGPDLHLRGYLRWGVERIARALQPYLFTDGIARSLNGLAALLLQELRDVPALMPSSHGLSALQRAAALPSAVIAQGVEALSWMVDDRGLAGTSDLHGLAWRLTMHEVFEQWVEYLCRLWAMKVGGAVASGRQETTTAAIRWQQRGLRSLNSLRPDIVVQLGQRTLIFDAKYKPFLDSPGEHTWQRDSSMLIEAHRHDLHQVLAYAAVAGGQDVTTCLVYPMRRHLWEEMARTGKTVVQAHIEGAARNLRLALIAVPLQVGAGVSVHAIAETLNRLLVDIDASL